MGENLVVAVGGAVMFATWRDDRGCQPISRCGSVVRARRGSSCSERGGCSGCERDAAASVAVQGERVDHDRVAEEVEGLALVAEAVGAAEPEGVVEVAVD